VARSQTPGSGMAKAGIITGIIGLVLALIVVVITVIQIGIAMAN
jgi:hypothetical protein